MKIIKRSGTEVDFDIYKIMNAITKANTEVSKESKISDDEIKTITYFVQNECTLLSHTPTVEDVQDMVEKYIIEKTNSYELAKAYILYRYKHELVRKSNTTDKQILSLIDLTNEEIKQENSNKNPTVNSVQRDYMAGEVSKDLTKRFLLPSDIVKAHEEGLIHFHDVDYFSQRMSNCCLNNLKDMLDNGTVISETKIDRPRSFSTACNITTQIIAQVASSQYGGQSITLSHLAPYVDVSRQKIKQNTINKFKKLGIEIDDDKLNQIVEIDVVDEVKRGVQMIQYQVITLMTTNGQAPFITVFMYINEVPEGRTRDDLIMIIKEMLTQRILGVKNESDVYITPAFPKLIYVLDDNNVYPGTKYYEITELAAKCTSKRMVPDYISAKIMKELKEDNVYTPMGCRSFLTPYKDENDNYKFYGRFNQGVVTINLVDVALSARKEFYGESITYCKNHEIIDMFWRILDQRLELCYRALMCRHNRLMGTLSDVAPIMWQHGAIARLNKGETIDKLLLNNYSTLSLGYAGLYECIKALTGKSHTDIESKPLALEIMQYLNDACSKWRKDTTIGFSLYGTPLESTTYKFAKCLQKRFGVIDGITDKNYITNSYHIEVSEEINAFDKLKFESEFQKLSPGGAISYVEVPNMNDNIPAVLKLMQYIYENIMYAELNTKSDYCQVCGNVGEILIETDDNGKLYWLCPNCGNTDQDKMNVARRTCGYIGTQFWNQGRTQEIKDRVLHL